MRDRSKHELTRPSLDEDAAILFLACVVGILIGVVLAVVIGP